MSCLTTDVPIFSLSLLTENSYQPVQFAKN